MLPWVRRVASSGANTASGTARCGASGSAPRAYPVAVTHQPPPATDLRVRPTLLCREGQHRQLDTHHHGEQQRERARLEQGEHGDESVALDEVHLLRVAPELVAVHDDGVGHEDDTEPARQQRRLSSGSS